MTASANLAASAQPLRADAADTGHITDRSPSEAAARLRGIVDGLRASQALFVAAQLGIADHLARGPLDGPALAGLTGTDPIALHRVMRALCALGIFSESPDGHFSLNGAAQLLRSDVRGSYRPGVLLLAGTTRWRCWSSLLETVRTGVNAAERDLGMPLFDFYAAHPAESKIHDDAMRSLSANTAVSIAEAIDLGEARVVVDVGGGTGELLAALLAVHPRVKGVLFDLPNVVRHAPDVLRQNKVEHRCLIEEGSFFERVPRGDTYLLKHILHDWDDERATAILSCCRRYMPATAKLLVMERRLPERAEPGLSPDAFLVDLEMLVMTSGGRERTEAQFRSLFATAGFQHERTIATASAMWVFEARPL